MLCRSVRRYCTADVTARIIITDLGRSVEPVSVPWNVATPSPPDYINGRPFYVDKSFEDVCDGTQSNTTSSTRRIRSADTGHRYDSNSSNISDPGGLANVYVTVTRSPYAVLRRRIVSVGRCAAHLLPHGSLLVTEQPDKLCNPSPSLLSLCLSPSLVALRRGAIGLSKEPKSWSGTGTDGCGAGNASRCTSGVGVNMSVSGVNSGCGSNRGCSGCCCCTALVYPDEMEGAATPKSPSSTWHDLTQSTTCTRGGAANRTTSFPPWVVYTFYFALQLSGADSILHRVVSSESNEYDALFMQRGGVVRQARVIGLCADPSPLFAPQDGSTNSSSSSCCSCGNGNSESEYDRGSDANTSTSSGSDFGCNTSQDEPIAVLSQGALRQASGKDEKPRRAGAGSSAVDNRMSCTENTNTHGSHNNLHLTWSARTLLTVDESNHIRWLHSESVDSESPRSYQHNHNSSKTNSSRDSCYNGDDRNDGAERAAGLARFYGRALSLRSLFVMCHIVASSAAHPSTTRPTGPHLSLDAEENTRTRATHRQHRPGVGSALSASISHRRVLRLPSAAEVEQVCARARHSDGGEESGRSEWASMCDMAALLRLMQEAPEELLDITLRSLARYVRRLRRSADADGATSTMGVSGVSDTGGLTHWEGHYALLFAALALWQCVHVSLPQNGADAGGPDDSLLGRRDGTQRPGDEACDTSRCTDMEAVQPDSAERKRRGSHAKEDAYTCGRGPDLVDRALANDSVWAWQSSQVMYLHGILDELGEAHRCLCNTCRTSHNPCHRGSFLAPAHDTHACRTTIRSDAEPSSDAPDSCSDGHANPSERHDRGEGCTAADDRNEHTTSDGQGEDGVRRVFVRVMTELTRELRTAAFQGNLAMDSHTLPVFVTWLLKQHQKQHYPHDSNEHDHTGSSFGNDGNRERVWQRDGSMCCGGGSPSVCSDDARGQNGLADETLSALCWSACRRHFARLVHRSHGEAVRALRESGMLQSATQNAHCLVTHLLPLLECGRQDEMHMSVLREVMTGLERRLQRDGARGFTMAEVRMLARFGRCLYAGRVHCPARGERRECDADEDEDEQHDDVSLYRNRAPHTGRDGSHAGTHLAYRSRGSNSVHRNSRGRRRSSDHSLTQLHVMDGSLWSLLTSTFRHLGDMVRGLAQDYRTLKTSNRVTGDGSRGGNPCRTGHLTAAASRARASMRGKPHDGHFRDATLGDSGVGTHATSRPSHSSTGRKCDTLHVPEALCRRFTVFIEALVQSCVNESATAPCSALPTTHASLSPSACMLVCPELFDFVSRHVQLPNLHDEYRRKIFLLVNVGTHEPAERSHPERSWPRCAGLAFPFSLTAALSSWYFRIYRHKDMRIAGNIDAVGEDCHGRARMRMNDETVPAELRLAVSALPLIFSPWVCVMILRDVLTESAGHNARYNYVLDAAMNLQLPTSTTRSRIATTFNLWRFLRSQSDKLTLQESARVRWRCFWNLPLSYALSSYWSLLTWSTITILVVLNWIGMDYESRLVVSTLGDHLAPWPELGCGGASCGDTDKNADCSQLDWHADSDVCSGGEQCDMMQWARSVATALTRRYVNQADSDETTLEAARSETMSSSTATSNGAAGTAGIGEWVAKRHGLIDVTLPCVCASEASMDVSPSSWYAATGLALARVSSLIRPGQPSASPLPRQHPLTVIVMHPSGKPRAGRNNLAEFSADILRATLLHTLTDSVAFPVYLEAGRVMHVAELERLLAVRIRRVVLDHTSLLTRCVVRLFPLERRSACSRLIAHTCHRANLTQRRMTLLVDVGPEVAVTVPFVRTLAQSSLVQCANVVLLVQASSLHRGATSLSHLNRALSSSMSTALTETAGTTLRTTTSPQCPTTAILSSSAETRAAAVRVLSWYDVHMGTERSVWLEVKQHCRQIALQVQDRVWHVWSTAMRTVQLCVHQEQREHQSMAM